MTKLSKNKVLKFAALTLVFFSIFWFSIWASIAFIVYDAGWFSIADLVNWEWERRATFLVAWVLLAIISAALAYDFGNYE